MLVENLTAFLGGYEVVLIVIAILILFGGKKIPELMRGLGKGVKEFKSASDHSDEKEKKDSKKEIK